MRNWVIKKLGGVPRDRYENMKRSRDHWKISYVKLNRRRKALPVDLDFTYKENNNET